jgi:AcrR family transcriptional regulator
MARPRTVSDEEILDAARAVFLEQGPGASTQLIADQLGVSQAALFKRFGTKKCLMIAALSPPPVPPFALSLATGPEADRDIQEQLREIAANVMQFFTGMVPRLSCLRAAGVPPEELLARFDVPPPMIAHQALCAWLSRGMEQDQIRSTEPAPLAYALLGSLHMRVFISHLTRRPLPPEVLTQYPTDVVDALWDGIKPPESQ